MHDPCPVACAEPKLDRCIADKTGKPPVALGQFLDVRRFAQGKGKLEAKAFGGDSLVGKPVQPDAKRFGLV